MPKPAYYIYQGQGVVGDLKTCRLASGQFSSCAPIVFFNEDSALAGLYHLAVGTSLSQYKAANLNRMITLVRPNVVYVLRGQGSMAAQDFSPAPGRTHLAPVRDLLGANGITEIELEFNDKRAFQSIIVSLRNEQILIEEGKTTTARKLNSKTEFVSLPADVKVIGERDETVLSQWA